MADRKDVIRETDAPSVQLAKTLMRTARYGALAVLDATDAWPLASRVGVATTADGTPVILISGLSAHTQALAKDPRCSLLLGEPSKGDPLAYPRITLVCQASRIARDSTAHRQLEGRYLARHPKAQLYVGLGDFALHRLDVVRASMNGGFGRAYHLTRPDLLCVDPGNSFATQQRETMAQVTAAIGKAWKPWRVCGVDAEGVDLMDRDRAARLFFPQPLTGPADAPDAASALAPPKR